MVNMAWVSVHDGVNGPKLRKLAKAAGVSKAEALGVLVTLWIWGLHNADCTGEIKYADTPTIAAAIPSDMLSAETDHRRLVEALISTGWIDNIDGVLYLHDWDEWQEQWYKFLGKKAYDAERKRNKRKEEREQRPQDCPPDSP